MAKVNYADVPLVTLLKDLYESQTKRRIEQKALDLAEEREKSIVVEILKREKSSFTSGTYVVSILKTEEPLVDSWPELLDYIKSTGELDLLEKRLLKSGAKLRWENGVALPGVSKTEKTTLKVEAQ